MAVTGIDKRQSINQSYFLLWPKQQIATSRTTEGRNSYKIKLGGSYGISASLFVA